MKLKSLLLVVGATLLTTTVANDTGRPSKEGRLHRRTGEDDKDKNSSSVAPGPSLTSKAFFSKDKVSIFAKDQPSTTINANKDDKVISSSTDFQTSSSLPSKDDKLPNVPAKDQTTANAFLDKDDKDKGSSTTSVTSTSVNDLQAFLDYVFTKDNDKKPTSTISRNVTSTSLRTETFKSTNITNKDNTQGPAVIVYTVAVPTISTPAAKSATPLLVAPSNLTVSGVTFPGYKIVPSPTGETKKDVKSEISTSTIPVWTPVLLGNAYGGGIIPTPSIYVVRQSLPNGPPTGVPPGYGGSSPQTVALNSSLAVPSKDIKGKTVSQVSGKEINKSVSTVGLGTGPVKVEATVPIVHSVNKTVLLTTTYCPVTTISGRVYTLSSTTLTKTYASVTVVAVTEGTPKVEATSPLVGSVTETILVTTTYCPVTTISGKVSTISSTTLTKTFATVTVVAVTKGTPTDIKAQQTASHSGESGNAPSHGNAPIITGGVPGSTAQVSGKLGGGNGNLPPSPSKEAGVSQGRFTNTSSEVSFTILPTFAGQETLSNVQPTTVNLSEQPVISLFNSQTSLAKSKKEEVSTAGLIGPATTESFLNLPSTPTASAAASSLVSELSSLFIASGSQVPTVTALPASLISQLLSVFGSPGLSQATATTSLLSPITGLLPILTASPSSLILGSKPEVKPTLPAPFVSELSSLLSPSGTQTQGAALLPPALISKVVSILVSPERSIAAASSTPSLASGAGNASIGLIIPTDTKIPSENSKTSAIKQETSSMKQKLGAGSSLEIAGVDSTTPTIVSGSLTTGSSVAVLLTPPAGKTIPVEGSGSIAVGFTQGSTASSPASAAGSPASSGATFPANGVPTPPALASLPSTIAIQPSGLPPGKTSVRFSNGTTSAAGRGQPSIAILSNAAGSSAAEGLPSGGATPAGSPSPSAAAAIESAKPSASAASAVGNAKPETSNEESSSVGTPLSAVGVSKIPQGGASNAIATSVTTPNGLEVVSGPVITAGTPASQGTVPSVPTPEVLPTPPEGAISSGLSASSPPLATAEQTSGGLNATVVSSLPPVILSTSSSGQSIQALGTNSGSSVPTGLPHTASVEVSSEASGAAGVSNVQSPALPGSTPTQASSILTGIPASSPAAGAPTGSSLETSSSEASGVAGVPSVHSLASPGSTPLQPSVVFTGTPALIPAAGTSLSSSPQTPSPEASGAAGVSSGSLESSPLGSLPISTPSLEGASTLSSVVQTPIVPPYGGSPAGPILSTGTHASLSTGINNGNTGGNRSVSVLLNPTAVSPFLGAGVKMPTPFAFVITALLAIFLL